MRFKLSKNEFGDALYRVSSKCIIIGVRDINTKIHIATFHRHPLVAVYTMISKKAVYNGINQEKAIVLFASLVLL